MPVTIKDVARKAGVSPSTVSRVLSKHPAISRETVARVYRIMDELGYQPNIMAKSLVSRSANTIALILPQPAEELFQFHFFHEVIRGIVANSNLNGFDLLLVPGWSEESKLNTLSRLIRSRRIDGVILMNSSLFDPLITFLSEQQFPAVIIGRTPDGSTLVSVDNDNVQAAYDATVHLIAGGHQRIGYVSGPPGLTVSYDRMEGYHKALTEARLPVRKDWIVEGDFLQETGYRAMSLLMSLPERPTALVVIDDLVALGVMRGITELGFQVPGDMCVVSFNNIALSELSSPSISSIDISTYQIGYTTSQSLIKLINGESLHQNRIIIPHRLVARESSMLLGKY